MNMELCIDGQQYTVQQKLGQGAHGCVFKIKKDEELALKIMQSRNFEFDILRDLQLYKGFPKIINQFKENEYECATMTLLGINLKALKNVSSLFPLS